MSPRSRMLLLATTTVALAVPALAPPPPALADGGPVTTLARNTRGEALAVDGSGTVVAVWATTSTPGRIVVRRHEPDGGWDRPVVLGRGYAPEVAVDGSGDVTVVWLTQRRGRTDGVAAARLPVGGDWTGPVHLSDDVAAPGHRPGAEVYGATDLDLAVNDGGDAVVAWSWGSETGHHPWRVQAVLRPADGPWGDPFAVSPADGSRTPVVGLDDEATALVVWGQQRLGTPQALRVRQHGDSGWTPAETLVRAGYSPDLAVDGAGDAVLLFADRTLAAAALTRPAGGDWGGRVRLSDPAVELSDADLALAEDGAAVVALGRPGGRVDLVERPAGGPWADPVRVVRPRVPVFDVLVAAGAGGTFLGWGGYGLYGAFRPAGGDWGSASTISPDAGVEVLEQTDAGVADDGSVAVLWKQEARPLKVRLLPALVRAQT